MIKKVACFEKVSLNQFKKDMSSFEFDDKKVEEIYNNIKLPLRATKYSAGYDFFLPFDVELEYNKTMIIPTGIRAKIKNNWVLNIYPRSGLGFKYQMALANTVGIIDADYYNALNEGHIMIKIVNRSVEGETIKLEANKAFAQGVFLQFGITFDDDTKDIRKGGFGSTKA